VRAIPGSRPADRYGAPVLPEVRRQPRGWTGPALATVGFGGVAWFLWSLGLGRYFADYCRSRSGWARYDAPGRGPEFASPLHVRCAYDDGTVATAVDVRPLLWALFVLLALLVVLAAAWSSVLLGDAAAAEDRSTAVRGRAVIALNGLALAFPGFALAVLSGPSLLAPGPERLDHEAGLLLVATLCAIGAGLCLREAAGTRRRWPWLVATLLAPAWVLAAALGA
jgi:hypothetical protein